MPLEQVRVVQVGRSPERRPAFGDRLDPVDAVRADRASPMRVAQQVPAAIADDHRARVDLFRPLAAGLAAVVDADPVLGGDRVNQGARDPAARADRARVGRGAGVPPHDRGLPANVLRQHPDDLAQGRANWIVGVRGGMAAVQHGHDQAKRLGGGEQKRRQPQAAAQPVATVGSPVRFHRDARLAQDGHVAPGRSLGHVQLLRQPGPGDAGLSLQQLEDPQRSPGWAEVGFHSTRLIRKRIVRNGLYRRLR